jgi:putative ABC transport system permease protein
MDALRQDLVYSLRALLNTPSFSAIVVGTLALGIGANSAMFSVIDAVLLRPLPFPRAERVVNVAWDGSGYLQSLSAAKFQYWHDHTRAFEAMATWQVRPAHVDMGAQVSAVRALYVSRDFLHVLGHPPALGRDFLPNEDAPGGRLVAIISHAIWRTHFGSTTDTIGRIIR